MHSVTDRQTDRQTDGRTIQYNAIQYDYTIQKFVRHNVCQFAESETTVKKTTLLHYLIILHAYVQLLDFSANACVVIVFSDLQSRCMLL